MNKLTPLMITTLVKKYLKSLGLKNYIIVKYINGKFIIDNLPQLYDCATICHNATGLDFIYMTDSMCKLKN